VSFPPAPWNITAGLIALFCLAAVMAGSVLVLARLAWWVAGVLS
jgi:hypothetical protein